MILLLWYDSTQQPAKTYAANEDWQAAEELWNRLKQSGKVQCEEVDTAGFSHEQRMEAYDQAAVVAASRRHYRVSKLFWKGRAFGGIIPALVVYETDKRVAPDVYPHIEGGKEVPIYSYVTKLSAELGLEKPL